MYGRGSWCSSRRNCRTRGFDGGPVVGDEIKLIIIPLKEIESEEDLVRHTKTDDSISNLRELADRDLNGYQWENICKSHDELDRVRKQICVPQSHRRRILQLAHEGFGHQSKNKVAHHIQNAFTGQLCGRM